MRKPKAPKSQTVNPSTCAPVAATAPAAVPGTTAAKPVTAVAPQTAPTCACNCGPKA